MAVRRTVLLLFAALLSSACLSDSTEDQPSKPPATEPDATEPPATEPTEPEPDATEPAEPEPDATEPAEPEPDATEPAEPEPDATEPAEPEPDATEPVELRWLAVGDSYSSGEGLPDIEANCSRSPSAYASIVSSRSAPGWRVEQFVFSACSGAVSDDWAEQEEAWGTGQPNLITATFGGNDIGFADVFMDCIGLDDGIEFLDDIGDIDIESVLGLLLGRGCDISEDEIISRIDRLEPILADLYDLMADLVGPEGNVFILGYPAPLADPDKWTSIIRCDGVSKGDAELLLRAADRLNEVITTATEARPNVHFVDVAPAFVGHSRCSDQEWIYGLLDSLDTEDTTAAGLPLIETARPFHPNEAGHRAMAEALQASLESVLTSHG